MLGYTCWNEERVSGVSVVGTGSYKHFLGGFYYVYRLAQIDH